MKFLCFPPHWQLVNSQCSRAPPPPPPPPPLYSIGDECPPFVFPKNHVIPQIPPPPHLSTTIINDWFHLYYGIALFSAEISPILINKIWFPFTASWLSFRRIQNNYKMKKDKPSALTNCSISVLQEVRPRLRFPETNSSIYSVC